VLYTLAKFFVWGLGFAIIGGVIGWLLRSVRCTTEVAAARATTVDEAEAQRLRNRVANLEPVVADRDQLRLKITELEAELRASWAPAAVAPLSAGGVLVADPEVAVESPEPVVAEPVDEVPVVQGFAGLSLRHDPEAAVAVLGKRIAADDLKIVEGIGPALEGVLHAGGITTWVQLANAEPDEIRRVLTAADDRHRMHDPSSWPRQARLAAIGEWEALRDLQERLTAGR
jgi:predicted flap endonuclease-1-like 5' DNA nuclease